MYLTENNHRTQRRLRYHPLRRRAATSIHKPGDSSIRETHQRCQDRTPEGRPEEGLESGVASNPAVVREQDS